MYYGHLLYSASDTALEGECVLSAMEQARFRLTRDKAEVRYCRQRAKSLLAAAAPLMEVYRSERAQELQAFLAQDAAAPGARRAVLSTLPLYTATDELLRAAVRRCGLGRRLEEEILRCAAVQRAQMEQILADGNTVTNVVPELTREEFEKAPPALPLFNVFIEQDVVCTYEEYRLHLQLTHAYAQAHPTYRVQTARARCARNLQILLHEGSWAMVSKSKSPAVHFVIRHEGMRRALERLLRGDDVKPFARCALSEKTKNRLPRSTGGTACFLCVVFSMRVFYGGVLEPRLCALSARGGAAPPACSLQGRPHRRPPARPKAGRCSRRPSAAWPSRASKASKAWWASRASWAPRACRCW